VAFAENAVEIATPVALVVSVSVVIPFAKVPLAEVLGALNVTATPLTGFKLLSRTVAAKGAANVVLIAALCGVPLVAVIAAGGPGEFVRLKVTGIDAPATTAITGSGPDLSLAVNGAEVATPLPLVVAMVALVFVSANVPLGTIAGGGAGAVNTTIALLTGFWPLSTTMTDKGAANAELIIALCEVPLVAVIVAGAPVVLLKVKLAGVVTPETEAVIV
jgi:hypothetical protein